MLPIPTRQEYTRAKRRQRLFFKRELATGERNLDEVNKLSLIVLRYEGHKKMLRTPDPIDTILALLKKEKLSPADLLPYFRTRSRVSEVLARKRPLTLAMIRRLREGLGIPADILIRPTMPANKIKDAA